MAHVTGQSRYQSTLFPEVLDEVVGRDDPVRVIDAFVEGLDLEDLGFSKAVAEEMGRPPYAPGDLLKLYIYGYLHRVRASRRLEAETRRNVQVMWLLNRLTPSFKTIADFRKDHAEAIVKVCRAFIGFCREQSVFGAELLAIDWTKIAALASRQQALTPKRIEQMNAAIDRKIADYLASMDEADREEPAAAGKPADVAAAIEVLKAQKERLQAQAQDMAARGLKQMVMTEPQARLMRTPHGHAVAHNAQTAVDAKHKLIAAFDLTNEGRLRAAPSDGGAGQGGGRRRRGDGRGRHRLFERRAWRAMRAGQDHGDRAETRDGQSEGHAILQPGPVQLRS